MASKFQSVYVIARNRSDRPTVQHELDDGVAGLTLCGVFMDGWSRAFMKDRIDVLFCRRCARIKGYRLDKTERHLRSVS